MRGSVTASVLLSRRRRAGKCSSRRRTSRITEGDSQNSRRWQTECQVYALVAVIPAALICLAVHSWSLPDTSHHRLSVENWTPSTLEQLRASAVPAVFQDTPFKSWPCMKWTFGYLKTSLGNVLAKESKQPIFKYYSLDKPLSKLPSVNSDAAYQDVMVPGHLLMSWLQGDERHDRYLYASGDFSHLGLSDDQGSVDELAFTSNPDHIQVNFWMGGANVTADWHYDTSDNLHVLIAGRKTFTLLPPSSHRQLKLYPSLHHYYRQTQVSICEENGTVFSNAVTEVTLLPGQVLYIPPYWFHSVRSDTASISINVWSQSDVFLEMERIFQLPIPFMENWSNEVMIAATRMFLSQLLVGLGLPVNFIRTLAEERYSSLLGVDSKGLDLQQLCGLKAFDHEEWSSEERHKLESTIMEHVSTHVEAFARMQGSVLTINLGNFIEHLLFRILGENQLDQLPIFMFNCFTQVHYTT